MHTPFSCVYNCALEKKLIIAPRPGHALDWLMHPVGDIATGLRKVIIEAHKSRRDIRYYGAS